MTEHEDSRILEAARAILNELDSLVGRRTARLLRMVLEGLLQRARKGEAVVDELLRVLGDREPTRRWLADYLAAESRDAEAYAVDDGEDVKRWRNRVPNRPNRLKESSSLRMRSIRVPVGAGGGGTARTRAPSVSAKPTSELRPGSRPPRAARVVSTGFARAGIENDRLPKEESLERATDYIFWLEVGRPVSGSIEEQPRELLPDEELQAGMRFDVVVQPFPGELEVDPEARTGQLVMDPEGRVRVALQPGRDVGPPVTKDGLRETMLRFPVRTPSSSGAHRLRCGIYFRNTVVQSRVVTAWVGRQPPRGAALSARVDISLARLLAPSELNPIREHALSVLVNDNDDSTHSFRFVSAPDIAGAAPVVNEAVISESALADLVSQSRGSMRTVAWGSPKPWTEQYKYRYGLDRAPDLTKDLFELVRAGRHLYDALINQIAGGPDAAGMLRQRMAVPGRVQFVSHGSPNELVPASMFYDYQNAATEAPALTLCPQFQADRRGPDPLEKSPCFRGACPSIEQPQVVCPSGFWGFRHAIGMPVVVRYVPAPPADLTYQGNLSLGVAAYPGFALWPRHKTQLEELGPPWDVRIADTYDGTIKLLKSHQQAVVYFYCHGGYTDRNDPYLLVGPAGSVPLVRSALRWDTIDRYAMPRILVILNGCQTAALEPDRAIEFVTAFVENVGAAGVIGTEITVFEELATAFGTTLLRQLATGIEIGEAVRRTRLALLKDGNPLGLVYLPMVQSDARLVAQA